MIAFLDASALIYLVDGEAKWAEATQATLQSFRDLMPKWSPVMLAFSASSPCKFE